MFQEHKFSIFVVRFIYVYSLCSSRATWVKVAACTTARVEKWRRNPAWCSTLIPASSVSDTHTRTSTCGICSSMENILHYAKHWSTQCAFCYHSNIVFPDISSLRLSNSTEKYPVHFCKPIGNDIFYCWRYLVNESWGVCFSPQVILSWARVSVWCWERWRQ